MSNIHDELKEKYGVTMNTADLAGVFHMKQKSVQNAISAGRFYVSTISTPAGRLAYTSEVADYLEKRRNVA